MSEFVEKCIREARNKYRNLDYSDDGEDGINVRIFGEYIANESLAEGKKQGALQELKRFKQVLFRLRRGRIQNNHLELDRAIEQLVNRLKELEA